MKASLKILLTLALILALEFRPVLMRAQTGILPDDDDGSDGNDGDDGFNEEENIQGGQKVRKPSSSSVRIPSGKGFQKNKQPTKRSGT